MSKKTIVLIITLAVLIAAVASVGATLYYQRVVNPPTNAVLKFSLQQVPREPVPTFGPPLDTFGFDPAKTMAKVATRIRLTPIVEGQEQAEGEIRLIVPGQGEFKFSLGPHEYLYRVTVDGEEYYWGVLTGSVPTKLGTRGFMAPIVYDVKQSKVLLQLQPNLVYGKNADGLYDVLRKVMGFR